MDGQVPKSDNPASVNPAPVDQATTPSQPQSVAPATGYKKRPLWFWVLLYVLLGGIVYAVIWWFFMSGDSSTGSLY